MSNNKHGLDAYYLKKNLDSISRDIEHYSPDEAFRALIKLAMFSADQAGLSVTVSVKPVSKEVNNG